MLAGLFYGEEDTTALNDLIKAGLKKILLIVLPITAILFIFYLQAIFMSLGFEADYVKI